MFTQFAAFKKGTVFVKKERKGNRPIFIRLSLTRITENDSNEHHVSPVRIVFVIRYFCCCQNTNSINPWHGKASKVLQ